MKKTAQKYPTYSFRVTEKAKAEIERLLPKAQESRNKKLGVTESPKSRGEIITEALIEGLNRLSKP